MTDPRHLDEDQLLELALGHAPTPERDGTTAHLEACVPCRRAYSDLADSVQLVLPVAPRVAPPPGFDADVLTALGRGGRSARSREQTPIRVRRRTVRLAVAAGLVGLAVGAGAMTGVLNRDEPAPITAPRDEAPLLNAGGAPVGSVAHGRGQDGPVLIVRIDDGPAGYAYTCRFVLADGSTRDAGRWRLGGEDPARWVVPVPGGGVRAVQMVSGDGTVWSAAEF